MVGSYLRLIDSCITQLKAHGPARTCNESKEDEEDSTCVGGGGRESLTSVDDCGTDKTVKVLSFQVKVLSIL